MKNMLKNWETSVIGLLMIIGGASLASYFGESIDKTTAALAAGLVLGGVGFLRGRDGNKSSEDVGAK